MKVFLNPAEAGKYCEKGSVIALGNFDGVHKGHAKLIKRAVKAAKEEGLKSLVFTFLNHPANVISGKPVVKNIMTPEEKASAIEEMGADFMLNAVFDEKMMKLSGKAFAKDLLFKELHCKKAVCGFNYSFGRGGEGGPSALEKSGEELGFSVEIIPEFKIDGVTVSSTLIRKCIADGLLEKYFEYTGRPYVIQGRVLKGQRFGRRIGFPTVNLNLSERYALPLNGVYITRTYVDGILYNSVTNVGNKPSVGSFEKNAETHIFGFDKDVYGEEISVSFIKMLRKERKFESIEALTAAIQKDCEDAKRFFTKGV